MCLRARVGEPRYEWQAADHTATLAHNRRHRREPAVDQLELGQPLQLGKLWGKRHVGKA